MRYDILQAAYGDRIKMIDDIEAIRMVHYRLTPVKSPSSSSQGSSLGYTSDYCCPRLHARAGLAYDSNQVLRSWCTIDQCPRTSSDTVLDRHWREDRMVDPIPSVEVTRCMRLRVLVRFMGGMLGLGVTTHKE